MIAVFGTLNGIGSGVFFGWAFVRAASTEVLGTFAAPWSQLLVVLAVSASG